MKQLISRFFLLCILLTGTLASSGQNFPSVKEVIMMNRMNSSQVSSVLKKYGYKKFKTIKGLAYWCKNCQVKLTYYPTGSPSGVTGCNFKNGVASSIEMYQSNGMHVSLDVYSKTSFMSLVKQIKALGYRQNDESGQGSQGQDWCFSKSGWPNLDIWNDYGFNYTLSVEWLLPLRQCCHGTHAQ